MMDRFSDRLRHENREVWEQAARHRFVQELQAGTIADDVMAGYLIQDYRFLDSFLALLGAALASADTLPAKLRLGQALGFICGDENTYFERAFAALGVDEVRRLAPPDTEPTAGFKAIMLEAAATRSYSAAIAVLCVAEWLYLDWASAAPPTMPASFVHSEWISLHDNPDFRDFVMFLRTELDRVGPGEAGLSRDLFMRAVRLEKSFLDAAYQPAPAATGDAF